MEISKLGNGAHQLELLPGLSSGGPLRYGAQPPPFNEPYDLIVMLDKVEPNRGPAYFFQHSYDKIVVVPEKQLSAGTSKRSLEDSSKLEERDWYHGGIAQPGHRPWFCFWNSTVLEGFVYITQDSSAASSSSVASAASATLSTTTGPPRSPPSTSGTATTTSTAGWKRQYSPAPMPSPMIAPCPKVVKIEERRHSVNAMQPYCQQMQVLNDGSVGTVTGPTGELVTVELNETEPIYQRGVRMSGVIGKRRRWWEESNTGRVEKKDVIANGCQCMWLSE